MSDEPTQDQVEQGSPEGTTTPPPWGDDFNPERAWNTITHLRGFEGNAKQFERLSKDQDAVLEFLREHHPDMIAEPEDEPEEEYEPQYEGEDPRIAQLAQQTQAFQQWQASVEADRAMARFNADLDETRDGRDINEIGREWIFAKTVELGDNKTALKKATEQWFAFEDSMRAPAPEPSRRPRAPHVVQNGGAAADGKKFSDMTPSEREAHMAERMRQLSSQT